MAQVLLGVSRRQGVNWSLMPADCGPTGRAASGTVDGGYPRRRGWLGGAQRA